MLPARRGLLAAALVALVATATLATARAAPPKRITAAGAGDVRLGMTYKQLRARGLVGTLGPGCRLAPPTIRSARLRSPLKGFVYFDKTARRKATGIFVTGGATARGVGVGATEAQIKRAFPTVVVVDSSATFGFALYEVPESDGGKLAFRVDATTRKVTIVGIPHIPFCD